MKRLFRKFFHVNFVPVTSPNVVYLVQAGDSFNTSMPCTPDGTRLGIHYRANVPEGLYDIYLNDGSGLMYEDHPHGLLDDSVETEKIGDIDTEHIKAGAIGTSELDTDAVTGGKITNINFHCLTGFASKTYDISVQADEVVMSDGE